MVAYTYPLLNILWSMLVFFGLVIWIWVLITVFVDIFRSPDIGGLAKAAWFALVLFLPLLGALIYLIARGSKMHERAINRAEEQEVAFREYVQDVAAHPNGSMADELSKLAALLEKGTITQQEFEEQKAKLLGQAPTQRTAA